jgi:putative membrane protein
MDSQMYHAWNDWNFGWGWILWFGIFLLFFSTIGNWGYTYRAHQKYGRMPGKDAVDILHERYARGEITREQLTLMKRDISSGEER